MNKRTLAAVLTAAALSAACGKSQPMDPGMDPRMDHAMEHAAHRYTCPMHPKYISDKPGDCPICGMTLVPVEAEGAAESGVEGRATVKLDAGRRQFIGLQTETARRIELRTTIRAIGRIAYDPELYRTQEEYLSALEAYREVSKSGTSEAGGRAKSLLDSSRLRLKIMGLSDKQIETLAERGAPETALLMAQGKGGRVWMYADVYAQDLRYVKKGQAVEAASPSLPGTVFRGSVAAKDAVINPQTRSARVRVEVVDTEGHLLPDMYLNAKIVVPLGKRLAVPKRAVLDTGERQLVFVSTGEGRFEPREVRVGARADAFIEIREGVAEGESVVTSGQFLIDSESNLKAALSGMAGGHNH